MFPKAQIDASVGYILGEVDTAGDDGNNTRDDEQDLGSSVHHCFNLRGRYDLKEKTTQPSPNVRGSET